MLATAAPTIRRTFAREAPPAPRGRVLNVAHRGASGRAPENTFAALAAAVADGADLVEFDVRRTRDGALVLVHDATLDRTTDARRVYPGRAPWRVRDFTLSELGRLDAGSWKGTQFAGERVPTLAQALDLVRPAGVGTLIELKVAPVDETPVAELTDELRCRAGPARTTVQSFDLASLRAVRERMPSVAVAVLGGVARKDLRELSRWADQVHPHHRRVDRRFVDEAHGWGMRCLVWTVNRPSGMRRACALGVDGVITDLPDLFRHLADNR